LVRAWLDAEDVDHDAYAEMIKPWLAAAYDPAQWSGNPVHALERGECPIEEFEFLLASRMVRRDGGAVPAAGLLTRMFEWSTPCREMYDVVYAARTAGLRTGLLSNSWGVADYPREQFPSMFDCVVISGEVGMRKPEERIFRHTLALLGVSPQECVFVDDTAANVAAAEAVGMTAVLHRDPGATVARLAALLGVAFPDGARECP
jgi:putative hydrolase of the HAD superfamily